ncbi:MAG: hypothetical protein M3Q23_12195, partial [Actinomycetota bacterium]|nr:hypothetical protein [Actinomycetota bacterium]
MAPLEDWFLTPPERGNNLWREHLGDAGTDEELLDPRAGFDRWRRAAEALDAWHRGGRTGPR